MTQTTWNEHMQHPGSRGRELHLSEDIGESTQEDICQLEPVAAHTLVNRSKKFVSIGKLNLFRRNNRLWITINHWNSQELLSTTTFFRLEYHDNVSYLFENYMMGFIALTIPKDQHLRAQLEDALGKIGRVKAFEEGMEGETLLRKIQYHCPSVEKTPIHKHNMMTKMFMMGGKVQAFLGKSSLELHHTQNEKEDIEERINDLLKKRWKKMLGVFRGKPRQVTEQVVFQPQEAVEAVTH